MPLETFERDYFDFLLSDELHQFKADSSVVTTALLKAIARQQEELLEAFRDLATKTNVDGSDGAQLDGCGDIVKLTRAQAGTLSNEVTTDFASIDQEILQKVTTPTELLQRHAPNGIIPFDVIDDERYREYVKYKIFLNSNHCTFPDVMKAIKMFWARSAVRYIEDVTISGQEYHAAMLLKTTTLRPEQNARLFFLIPIIKAAGVLLLREATTYVEMQPDELHVGGVIAGTVARVTIPQITVEI
jgi:hypothetical protein